MKKQYLNETQFQEIQPKFISGQAQIKVDRNVARQVFTHVPNKSIVETTGRSMLGKKVIILTGLILPVILFLACLILIVYYFGWYSTIVVPLTGIFWTIIVGLTADKGTWIHSTAGIAVGLGIAVLVPINFGIPIALFSVSLWLQRMTYLLAEIWVTELVTQSYGAYDMLAEHLSLSIDDATSDAT
ncbi:MAG: hypothetical protein WD002_08690 [Pseudomonadales bacterium]